MSANRLSIWASACLCGSLTLVLGLAVGAPSNFIIFNAPGAGTDSGEGTQPKAVNEDGEITGNYKDAHGVEHGFLRHKDGRFDTFDAPGARTKADTGTSPESINKDGEIAGYYDGYAEDMRHGFVRHKDGAFTTIDAPGSVSTVVQSTNEHGDILGNFVAVDQAHGFVVTNGTFTAFDPPGSFNTAPTGINADGEITGYYADAANALHGFLRLKDGAFSAFDAPGANTGAGLGTFPMSINRAGEIAGRFNIDPDRASRGFLRHQDGTFASWDPPGSINDSAAHTDAEGYVIRAVTAPISINSKGEIAGYYGDSMGVLHGFVRRSSGVFSTFDVPGASTSSSLGTFAMDMNENGEGIGFYYVRATSVVKGFLLKLTGPPSAQQPKRLH